MAHEQQGMSHPDKVTLAWGRIHERHPGAYKPRYLKQIGRLGHRDFARLVHKYCPLPDGALILEVGCGSGRDSLYFSTLGYRCVALDYYLRPLQNLSASVRAPSTSTLAPLLACADAFSLPFPNRTFNLVFNSGVIEHYDSEGKRHELLSEMRRVLRPDGFMAVAIPNRFHVLDPIWSAMISRFSDHDEFGIPEQRISLNQLVHEMESAGLAIVEAEGIDAYDTIAHYPFWLPLRILAHGVNSLFPQLPSAIRRKWGTRFLVVARNQ